MIPRRVAIIGTGMAGLACAEVLHRSGIVVLLFDKGHRPGGRIATRRLGGAGFDHGAQFATARLAAFQAELAKWASEGAVAVWDAASSPGRACWVGVPSMAAMVMPLVRCLPNPPEQARHVGALHASEDGWRVRHHPAEEMRPGAVSTEGGELAGPFEAVLLALPAPQTTSLLAATGHGFAHRARQARYAPCWTLMASFAEPLDLPDVRGPDSGLIAWTARQASRPGREASERFVVNASAAWSEAHLELSEPDARAAMLAAFGVSAAPIAALAHRWRFALVQQALGQPCLWDKQAGLGACGDWCLGGRVEAAWESGRALADAVLAG